MLEISNNESVGNRVKTEDLKSFKQLDEGNSNNRLKRWLLILICIFIAILFLPWTQNIDSKGVVTSLNPEQRPQLGLQDWRPQLRLPTLASHAFECARAQRQGS